MMGKGLDAVEVEQDHRYSLALVCGRRLTIIEPKDFLFVPT